VAKRNADVIGNPQSSIRSPQFVVVGTRAYMPPEQARGEAVDARADIYAIGGILHFLLTGAPPDAGASGGPRALQAIVAKARALDPRDRYGDALALAADVDRFLAGDPVTANRESALERVVRFTRKHRVAIVLVVAYLVLRAAIAWLAP
jgi:serine/threonine protein kinase